MLPIEPEHVSKEDLMRLICIVVQLMEENKRLKKENRELRMLLKSASGISLIDANDA